MMMPRIFGENLFDDFMDDFSFPTLPDVDKELYGKHAKNLMKTDVKETDDGYQVAVDLPGFKKEELSLELKNGYLMINAAKGLDKEEKEEKTGMNIVLVEQDGTRSFLTNPHGTLRSLKVEHIQMPFPESAKIICFASIFVFPKIDPDKFQNFRYEICIQRCKNEERI